MRGVVYLVLACLILCVCRVKHAESQNEIFIIPILWHGPNNQITEIKEAISMSHLVPGSVVVVPNLQEHKFSDGGIHQMLSKELFDFNIMAKANAPFVLLDDLRKVWDGGLDVILFLRDEDFPGVHTLVGDMGLTAPEQNKWIRSPVSVTRGCRQDKVQRLRELLRPYRYVGMLCYDDFALQTHKLAGTLLSKCGLDQCCQAYKERSVLLRKSPQVYELAESYVRRAIGKGQPFIAGHIRPMPDDCVKLWQSPAKELDPKEMSRICRTDFMYDRFVPNLQHLQQRYNTKTVFIMTHPLIRPRVAKMLQAGGIEPLFIDVSDLNASIRTAAQPLQTPLSFSFLAMVEEAVAAAATAFLGTAESSMTGMIVQERIARGSPPDSSFFIAAHPNCTRVPRAVPEYYVLRDARFARARKGKDEGGPLLAMLLRQ